MATETFTPLKGHCTCKTITYEILAPFLNTNCCHCTWCQRETGTAFVLNSIIENSNFRITSETKPVLIDTSTTSGDVHTAARCPKCYVALYHDGGKWTTFVRAGTLDDESKKSVQPDVHIFISTKMDWVDLSSEKERGVPIMEGNCRIVEVWRKDALERYNAMKEKNEGSKEAEEVSVA